MPVDIHLHEIKKRSRTNFPEETRLAKSKQAFDHLHSCDNRAGNLWIKFISQNNTDNC